MEEDDNNLFITKSDKGNWTIIIDRSEYINKVKLALQDDKYYKKINKNPLLKLIKLKKEYPPLSYVKLSNGPNTSIKGL